jgi:hypothetical protein
VRGRVPQGASRALRGYCNKRNSRSHCGSLRGRCSVPACSQCPDKRSGSQGGPEGDPMKAEAGVSTKAGLRCEQREIVGGRERCHHPKRSQDHPLFATPSRGKRSGPGRDSRRRSSEFSPATWVALTAAALWAPSMCAHAFSMGAHALSIASRQPSRAAPGWGSMQTGRAQCCEVRQTAAIACRTRTHQLLTHCMLSCSTRARTHTHTHTHTRTRMHACMRARMHART